jgi:hypothetical protein
MDAAGREMQVRKFVEEVWNNQNYQAVSDLYADTYVSSSSGSSPTPGPCKRVVAGQRGGG